MNDQLEFQGHLKEVFGERCVEFSDDLRQLLKELWLMGIQTGVYAKTHNLPVPEDVVWFDRSELAKKKAELAEKKKEKLIEMAELLAVRLETTIRPELLLVLEGDDLVKGMHNYVARTERLLNYLKSALTEAESFRTFVP